MLKFAKYFLGVVSAFFLVNVIFDLQVPAKIRFVQSHLLFDVVAFVLGVTGTVACWILDRRD